MDASAILLPGAIADGAWGLPTVCITANQSRILLSVPEGTTRRSLDQRLSLPIPSLEPLKPTDKDPKPGKAALFLPAASAAAAGGLHGTIMSIADGAKAKVEQLPIKQLQGKHVPPLTLIGPPGTKHIVSLARSFSRRDGFGLEVTELERSDSMQPVHADANLAVYALCATLPPSMTSHRASSPALSRSPSPDPTSGSPDRAEGSPRKKRRPSPIEPHDRSAYLTRVINTMFDPRGKNPGGRAEDTDASQLGANGSLITSPLPLPDPPALLPSLLWGPGELNAGSLPPHAVTYVVETSGTLPKIDLNRAMAHGCPPGPHMRDLREGKSVTLARPRGWIVPDLENGEVMPEYTDQLVLDEQDTSRHAHLLRQARWLTVTMRNPGGLQGRGAQTLRKTQAALDAARRKPVPAGGDAKHASKIRDLEKKVQHATEAHARSEQILSLPMEDATITTEQITDPPLPGGAMAQVYLPHVSYLDSFLDQAPQVFGRYTSEQGAVVLRSVLHVVHPDVLQDSRYKAWCQSLSSGSNQVEHIVSSAPYCADTLSYPRAALGLHKVSHLDPDFFSVPPYSLQASAPLPTLANTDPIALDQSLFVRLTPPPRNGASAVVSLTQDCPEAKAVGRPQVTSLQEPLTFDLSDPQFSTKADAEVRQSFEREMLASGGHEGILSKRQMRAQAKVDAWNEYVVAARDVRDRIATMTPPSTPAHWEQVVITPLGTGSASPSRDRNVSSTLIEYDHRTEESDQHDLKLCGTILLDCGESTLGQICRRLGSKRAAQVLRDLRMIFVSHKHADHLLGLFRVLTARASLQPTEPCYLITSDEVFGAVREWHAMENLGLACKDQVGGEGVHFVPAQSIRVSLPEQGGVLVPPTGSEESKAYTPKNQQHESYAGWWYITSKFARGGVTEARMQALSERFGLELGTVPVNHRCVHAYAGILSHSIPQWEGHRWALAYSGDTLPSSALAMAARNAQVDVVLHEATMGDDLVDDAFIKRHSTMTQALGVVRSAQAPLALLTHFSQRYPKLPKLNVDGQQGGPTVALSFDLMRLQLSEAWKFPLFLPVLEMLYRADEEFGGAMDDSAAQPAQAAQPVQPTAQTKTAQGTRSQTCKTSNKSGEWTYLLWSLSPSADATPLSSSSVTSAMESAIVSMHGQVGGAIRVAPVHLEVGIPTQLVLRVATNESSRVASALSGASIPGYRPSVAMQAHSVLDLWSQLGSGEVPSWVHDEQAAVKEL